jgi:putative SOS response-associated peptidase YedK
MCGRFTLTVPDPDALVAAFSLDSTPPNLSPRYNISPTQPVATVVQDMQSEQRELVIMRWGLIPSWSKDPSIGSKLINARSESAAEKPSFRVALSKRRCLVVADGFYEWQAQDSGPKQPMYITLRDHQPFGFAGLYEHWTEPESGEVVTTCTILTGTPNELVSSIHTRMAIILPRDAYDLWLDPSVTDVDKVTPLFKPYPADQMLAYPVSRRVNTPAVDDAELIERVG